MRLPKKINFKIVLTVLAVAGLVAFLLKDFVFQEKLREAPIQLGEPLVSKKVVEDRRSKVEGKIAVPSTFHPPPSALPAKQAFMAIILDDWGNNYSLVKEALAVKRPMTLAVLPNLPFSKKIADEAHKNHLGVILHMPMQPKDTRQPLEPHTILTSTPDTDIDQLLGEAFASVPHAEGMNNHMGSAATSDLRVMRSVLKYLKAKGLFFVDSNVIPTTVGPRVAKETGIPFTKRGVFIDNEPTVDAVKKKLLEAKNVALRKGQVVVIGHDKKATLQAIREMVPQIEKEGVRLVLVKELATIQKK